MKAASKHGAPRSQPLPSQHETNSDNREADTRHRLRNALPGVNTGQHHRDKQHRSTRQAAKDTVQSALELRPPISFDHLLRRDRRTPAGSRRGSGNNVPSDVEYSKPQLQTHRLQQQVGVNDVNKSKDDNGKREQELRSALEEIEAQGMQSTRELDNTYYILLEKAENLRDIVSNMQKLAKESHSLRQDFREQSHELQVETKKSNDAFEDFTHQERSIKSLLARLNTYKKKGASLDDRLEAAKTRVEACERRILKAQLQRKKRWEATWAIILVITVLVIAALVARQRPRAKLLGNNGLLSKTSNVAMDVVSPMLARLKSKPSEDPYLNNLFDGIL